MSPPAARGEVQAGATLVGVFIGGASKRMGGTPKGMLLAPGQSETIAQRLIRVSREALPNAELVLVGRHEAYAELGVPMLADEPPGVGPIGGLGALLAEAERRAAEHAISLACDMPHVSAKLLAELALYAPEADAVAPRMDDRWQPLLARYRTAPALAATRAAVAAGQRALFDVLERLDTRELPIADPSQLRDWDRPADIER